MLHRLELAGVRRSFGEGRGLAGVDLVLDEGEIYGLLGPNGAGKTSVIRAITGRLRLDGGVVALGGDARSARRRLGLVPQDIALYAELSVRENLELLGRLAGLRPSDARRRAAEALTWINLEDRSKSRVATLSGGQKRRVNVAAATLHDPSVLLLDEPTVGIDPPARERIHDLLRDLRRRGVAILLATHDLEQAADLCDRIGILVEGRIRAEGTLARLVQAAFGEARALELRLEAPPDERGLALLMSLGLERAQDPRVWSGPLAGGIEALASVARELSAGGLVALEVRVREPDLRSVFFHVAGREFDA